MEPILIKQPKEPAFAGCDLVLRFSKERPIRVLQLTDVQVIDASQRRTPGRLRPDEIAAWDPKNFDLQCGDHIRSLMTQARPDLVIITGDLVYGSFDDNGQTMDWFCRLMDSFGVYWAPVFGNHDNESNRGVDWQCERLQSCRYCLFQRGDVTGNGNYTIGIAVGDSLLRVIHMLDSNGCRAGKDPAIQRTPGLYPDQLDLLADRAAKIRAAQKQEIPAFMAFHIPLDLFQRAAEEKGYAKDRSDTFVIGVNRPAKDRDFGFSLRAPYECIPTQEGFVDFLRAVGVDGVFAGHVHNSCFSISWRDIVWTFGLKSGQYDFHVPYQIGGTLITLSGPAFFVQHLPALVPCRAFPSDDRTFEGFFAQSKE